MTSGTIRLHGLVAAAATAVVLAGCAGPTTATPPPVLQPTAEYVEGAGWVDRPAVPAAAPRERWRVPLDETSRWAVDPAGAAVLVARGAAGSTTVQHRDPATGTVRWQAAVPGDLPDRILLPAGGRSPEAVVSTGGSGPRAGGSVTVLDLASGRVRAAIPLGPDDSLATVTGDTVVVRTLRATPGSGGSAGSAGFDRATGAVRWRDGPALSRDPAGPLLVTEVRRGERTAVDPRTGRTLWRAPGSDFSGVAAAGDRLLVAGTPVGTPLAERAPAGEVSALDPATGRTLWTTPASLDGIGRTPTVAPTADGGALLVAFRATVALDARTGAPRWRFGSAGAARSVRVGTAGYAIALTEPSPDPRPSRLTVLDTDRGALVGEVQRITGGAADVAGGAVYAQGGADTDLPDTAEPDADDGLVTARALPALTFVWSVRTGPLQRLEAVPGGFVAATGRGFPDDGDLVGWVG